ncbi:MAG: galactose oxidase early set domain-containing protein, partial [Acidobacteriota bacterium]|nr:galactose oxidase early set domain-containing protein [Acidobacteriota bacterium]
PQQANPSGDSHPDAQLYSPPYLFKGPRPKILVAPVEVSYASTFGVTVDDADPIAKVSWIRLTSVTHSTNQNELLIFLPFVKGTGKITVTAPASANIAPPGHYMLFLVSAKGVPSIGHTAHISDTSVAAFVHNAAFALFHAGSPAKTGVPEIQAAPAALEDGRLQVVVGITPACPYGISACWAGAHDGLNHMSGIEQVWPTPDGNDSTASVYLERDTLPDIDLWRMQFAAQANGSYQLRGIEMTLVDMVTDTDGLLTLRGNETRPDVTLAPLQAPHKVQWSFQTRENWPVTPDEETAYARLSAQLVEAPAGATVRVVGPLKKNGDEFYLEVRDFSTKV